jgi:hypothetical protein
MTNFGTVGTPAPLNIVVLELTTATVRVGTDNYFSVCWELGRSCLWDSEGNALALNHERIKSATFEHVLGGRVPKASYFLLMASGISLLFVAFRGMSSRAEPPIPHLVSYKSTHDS